MSSDNIDNILAKSATDESRTDDAEEQSQNVIVIIEGFTMEEKVKNITVIVETINPIVVKSVKEKSIKAY